MNKFILLSLTEKSFLQSQLKQILPHLGPSPAQIQPPPWSPPWFHAPHPTEVTCPVAMGWSLWRQQTWGSKVSCGEHWDGSSCVVQRKIWHLNLRIWVSEWTVSKWWKLRDNCKGSKIYPSFFLARNIFLFFLFLLPVPCTLTGIHELTEDPQAPQKSAFERTVLQAAKMRLPRELP